MNDYGWLSIAHEDVITVEHGRSGSFRQPSPSRRSDGAERLRTAGDL